MSTELEIVIAGLLMIAMILFLLIIWLATGEKRYAEEIMKDERKIAHWSNEEE